MNTDDVRAIVRDELRCINDPDRRTIVIRKTHLDRLEAVTKAARAMRTQQDSRSAADLYSALHELDIAEGRYTA